ALNVRRHRQTVEPLRGLGHRQAVPVCANENMRRRYELDHGFVVHGIEALRVLEIERRELGSHTIWKNGLEAIPAHRRQIREPFDATHEKRHYTTTVTEDEAKACKSADRSAEHQAENCSRGVHRPLKPCTCYRRPFVGHRRWDTARGVSGMNEND